MGGRARVVALAVLALAAIAPAEASAELAFHASACDQGGVRFYGPGGKVDGVCRAGIFRVADDGSGLTRLTNGLRPGEAEDDAPSADLFADWSPTGLEIVFERQEQNGNANRLWVVSADGSVQRKLIPDPGNVRTEGAPAWSPRGDVIAFSGYESIPGQSIPFMGIFTVRPDGGDIRRVSIEGRGAGAPLFMPDGRLVYYERSVAGPKSPGFHTEPDRGLVAANLATGAIVPLTFGDATPPIGAEAFSDDGRYVAGRVMATGTTDARTWVMRIDTGEVWPASRGQAIHATFSSLGPALFYAEYDPATGTNGLYRVELREGAAPVEVARGLLYGFPDWSALGGVIPAAPRDVAPPAVILGRKLPPVGRRRVTGAQSGEKPSKLPFFAVDFSGISRLEAAVGWRVKGGCRFLQGSKLGKRRACARPLYVRIKSLAGWRERTSGLPRGKYEVRFRASDGAGNATVAPRRDVVTVK